MIYYHNRLAPAQSGCLAGKTPNSVLVVLLCNIVSEVADGQGIIIIIILCRCTLITTYYRMVSFLECDGVSSFW